MLFLILAHFPAVTAMAELEWERTTILVEPPAGTKQVEVSYGFTNRGQQPVRVWVGATSCGCTTPKLEKDIYAPGESGRIDITYRPGAQSGVQEKTIEVATDEPGMKPTVLRLKANLTEVYRLMPRLLHWRLGEVPAPKEIVFSVAPEFSDLKPELQFPSGFRGELIRVGESLRYTIRVEPRDTGEIRRSWLKVRLQLPEAEPEDVPVMLLVQ